MSVEYIQGWQSWIKGGTVISSATVRDQLNNLLVPHTDNKALAGMALGGMTDTSALTIGWQKLPDGQYACYQMTNTPTGLGYSYYLRFFPKVQKTGKTFIGARLKKSSVVTDGNHTARINGNLTSGSTALTAISVLSTSLAEVYIEFVIDWGTSKIEVWYNDNLNTSYGFTSITELWIGSHAGNAISPPSNTSGTKSWAFSAAGGLQYISDIYAAYDAPDDETPTGRLGPIYVRAVPMVRVGPDTLEFVGTTKEEWLTDGIVLSKYYEKGIKTLGDGVNTVVTFSDVNAIKKQGETIKGFGISQVFANFDITKPTKLVGKISGPSGKDYTPSFQYSAGGSSYANPVAFSYTASPIDSEDFAGLKYVVDASRRSS